MAIDTTDKILEIVEGFLHDRRSGLSVTVENVLERFPDLADEISEYLPTIAALEDIASDQSVSAQTFQKLPGLGHQRLEQTFGRFQIDGILGSGGMSVVYLATDTELKRQVALKIPRYGHNAEFLDRFSREATAMAKISHRNVCQIYDVGECEGIRFIAMQYIEGQTLASVLASGTILENDVAARLIQKVCIAVQAAHDKGVIHRDLKPSNIMLAPDRQPIVMDFGLASCEEADDADLTKAGAILGSPSYMAPEQVAADASLVGPATDVYALGVILYQLLAGCKPFTGTSFEIMKQIELGPPQAPSKLKPGVDPQLERICLKAMSKRPSDRYASPKELANVLSSYRDVPPRTSSRLTGSRPGALAIFGVLAIMGLLFWQISVTIWTPRGAVIVKSPPDLDVRVKLSKQGRRVAVIGPDNDWSVTLEDGRYDVQLLTSDTTATINAENVEVRRGEKQELVITKVVEPDAGDGRAAAVQIQVQPSSDLVPPLPQPTYRSSGRFVDSGQELGDSESVGVELADLDGDGDLDAFVTNIQHQPNRVWLNQGDGSFQDSGQRLGRGITALASLADLDGDGDWDAVTANDDTPCQIWLNDGAAEFSPGQQMDAETCHHVAVVDIERDGDLDLVMACMNGQVQIWRNEGQARFVTSDQMILVSADPMIQGNAWHHTAVGDVDGDNDDDLVISSHDDDAQQLWLNNGEGEFQESPVEFKDVMTRRCELLDFDFDGDLDVLTCSHEAEIALWTNDGAGRFVRSHTCGHWNMWNSCRYADLNGDGFFDVVGAAGAHFPVPSVVWLSDDQGVPFWNEQRLGTVFCQDIAVGDLDGDGDLDLFQANMMEQANRVWMNQD